MSLDTSHAVESLKGAFLAPFIMVSAMTLSMLVVLCARRPQTQQEWVIGIISTLVCSLCGGAAFILQFNLQEWAQHGITGLMALGGIIFACGLPGWAIVRLIFNTIKSTDGKTLPEVVKEVKDVI